MVRMGWMLRALCELKSARHRETNAVRPHISVKLKKPFSETECRLMVISGRGGVGRNGAMSDKGDQLLVSR